MRILSVLCLSLLAAACGKKAEDAAREAPPAAGAAHEHANASNVQDANEATPAPAGKGQALFERSCAMCHREMGMGTGLLARRTDIALLEQREDLTTEYIIQAARTGIGNMPVITRGEVSDAELKEIAGYLAKTEN